MMEWADGLEGGFFVGIMMHSNGYGALPWREQGMHWV